MLILSSACNSSATFGSSRSLTLRSWTASERHFIPPPKQCREPSYNVVGWSYDSPVKLPPMGKSLLHKGTILLLLANPFWYREESWLPATFPIGVAISLRSTQHGCLLFHTASLHIHGNERMFSLGLFVPGGTPKWNTTPSKPALQGSALLSLRESMWCDFMVFRRVCLPLPQVWHSTFKDFFLCVKILHIQESSVKNPNIAEGVIF